MKRHAIVDPRAVPVWREATAQVQAQPPVAAHRLTAEGLRQRFAAVLPWQQEPRREHYPSEPTPVPAAVLIGLQAVGAPDADAPLRVVLTQRTAHLSSHAGQIAFPGGKLDGGDRDAAAAALREAHEEIGLPHQDAQVLGELPVYVTGTGYRVTPVVALLPPEARFAPNPCEVEEVFAVPLAFLMQPRHHFKHQWQMGADYRHEWFSIPYTEPLIGRERYIWGVTAGILRDFYRFLSA